MKVTIDLNHRKVRLALAGAILTTTVVAAAGEVDIPNSFSPGDIISSEAMNVNFNAIEAAVDDNAQDIASNTADVTSQGGRLDALETGLQFRNCQWVTTPTSSGSTVTANCPAGKFVIQGGCLPGGSGLPDLRASFPVDGSATPQTNDPPTGVDRWRCQFNGIASTNTAFALCCDA